MEEIIKVHGGYVYKFAFYISANPDTAEELVQRTFIKVWQKQKQLKDIQAIRSWLRTICLNEFRMMMKKKSRQMEECYDFEVLQQKGMITYSENINVIDEMMVSQEVENLRNGCFLAMVRKLTLPQRITFSLVDMFGLSIRDAALLLDVKEGAIKGLLYRARLNLDAFFAEHCQFIKEENTCRCQAWIDFAHNRAKIQEKMEITFSALEFEKRGYIYKDEVRNKIHYYYQHIPCKKPEESWYLELINYIFNQKIKENT